ncbi:glycosyltransferase family 39 protein [Patescibacteria group bacterium]|nr:glycosyltransferase family 39 protein [Patescibacteria group bacterium]
MPKTNLLLVIIIIAGAFLRLYNLTAISLWHDEAFSALLIRYPFWEMMQRIALDVHPPFYYLILRLWDFVFGDSLFSLRLFSAFWGILAVYFVYLFIKTAFKNERLALVSAALIAINPFQIQYATEARMYTLGVFLIVLSSYFLVKSLESKSYRWWILYGISAALAIHTHYYLIFSVAAQAIFIALVVVKNYKSIPLGNQVSKYTWKPGFQVFTGAVVAYITAFLIFLPWLKIFLRQLSQVEQNYWIPKMTASSIPNTLWKMLAGSNIEVNNLTLAMVAIIFLLVFYAAVKRQQNNYKWLIVFSFIIPFALAIILSFKRSLYLDRYFVFAGLFYLIIFAVFIESIKNRILKSVLIALFIAGSLFLFYENWRIIGRENKPGTEGASAYILKQNLPQDKLYIASSFVYFTYKYYAYQNYFYGAGYPADFSPGTLKTEDNIIEGYRIYPEYLTPLLYTPGVTKISQLPHFSGTALLNNSDLLNDFSRNVKPDDTIWVLWTTGFGGSKPEIPTNWKQIDEAGFEDVFGYRGWIVVTKYKVL